MRFRSLSDVITLTVATAGTIGEASPTPTHNHQRHHVVRRSVVKVWKTVDVPFPEPTVNAFVLNGNIVAQDQVCKGIDDGTLVWEDAANALSECLASSTEVAAKPLASTTATQVAPALPSVAVEQKEDVKAPSVQSSQAPESSTEPGSNTPEQSATTTSVQAIQTTSADAAPIFTSRAAAPSPEETSSSAPSPEETSSSASSSVETSSPQSNSTSEGQGLELEFPDGTIDCSTFPSEYGPIEVEWANLGGWAGIQYVTVESGWVTNIVTAVPGGKGCVPGAMCSYACPPGYQKSQWPSTQGQSGQSVGGIQCNSDGKLSLTNPSLSKNLCIQGTGATTVENKLANNAAICRTDYPGLSIAYLNYSKN